MHKFAFDDAGMTLQPICHAVMNSALSAATR